MGESSAQLNFGRLESREFVLEAGCRAMHEANDGNRISARFV
jgi:hypothetical protein